MSTSSATFTTTASLQGIRFERDVKITGVGKTFTISRTGRFTGVKRSDGKHKVDYDYDGYGDSGFIDLDEVTLYRPTPEQAAAFAAESKVGV